MIGSKGRAAKEITQRQIDVLEAVIASVMMAGHPPTIRELGESLGIRSTNGVSDHLRALERKGFLQRSSLKSRAMRVLRLPDGTPFQHASEAMTDLVERAMAKAVRERQKRESAMVAGVWCLACGPRFKLNAEHRCTCGASAADGVRLEASMWRAILRKRKQPDGTIVLDARVADDLRELLTWIEGGEPPGEGM